MRYLIVLCLLMVGCAGQSDHLSGRIVTDSDGCQYMVRPSVLDVVFLSKLKDVDCMPKGSVRPFAK